MTKNWRELKNELSEQMDAGQRQEYLDGMAAEEAAAQAAEVVWQARHHAGLTQEQLAARLGKRQAYISALETGHGNPTVATLARVVAAAGRRLELSSADGEAKTAA